ncbi:hypothetical protein [Filimonas effusa]|uniref:Uncharacterized protein n=1 Tax=Filimonas effusa TaxID=2508721 RepID=A0A4Q1DA61_9BACT|nr:hypothetical protein [Filimonas effusa]RXK85359.1 hypothetical protein ESB13_00605 [Filimonas effusa]
MKFKVKNIVLVGSGPEFVGFGAGLVERMMDGDWFKGGLAAEAGGVGRQSWLLFRGAGDRERGDTGRGKCDTSAMQVRYMCDADAVIVALLRLYCGFTLGFIVALLRLYLGFHFGLIGD